MKKVFEKLKQQSHCTKGKDGKLLFHPWGKPGEAFVLNKEQEAFINICSSLGSVSYCIFCLSLIYGRIVDFITLSDLIYLLASINSLFCIIYFACVFYLKDRANLYTQLEKKKSDRSLLFLWVVFCSLLLAILWSFTDESLSFVISFCLKTLMGILAAVVWHFMRRIGKSNGYYFTSLENVES